MFVSSGSEANEIAMKFAHLYWAAQGRRRQAPVRVELRQLPRQHGRRAERVRPAPVRRAVPPAGPAGRDASPRRRSTGCPCPRAAPPPPSASPGSATSSRALDLRRTAAVLLEGVGGSGSGVLVPPPGFLEELRRLCDASDVLWISDEVMSGFGRTGEVVRLPALGRGPGHRHLRQGRGRRHRAARRRRPVRASSGSRSARVHPAMTAGHTFTNAPLACAAGVATIEALEEEGLLPG